MDERQKKIEGELGEEKERKERKYSNDSDSDSDDEKKYQRNNFMNKEKDYGISHQNIKICQNCKWVCFLCCRNFKNENGKVITQVYARAHLNCLNFMPNKDICPLC